MMYAVTARRLAKDFKVPGSKKTKRVLDNITFSLPVHDRIALVGPNGSGKTTLMKILATLYLPDEGDCSVLGRDLVEEEAEVRKLISFVSPGLDFHRKLTLNETLEFFAKAQKANPDPALEFIDLMNLSHKLNDRIESFSEGQKALTRLAIGLMKDAPLVLLDEVTATLDVNRKEQVIEFLNTYLNGKTMIMVDHDSQVVDRLCKRVMILNRGGTVARIMQAHDLIMELPYMYEITMTPKKKITPSQARKIWPDFELFGGKVRFFAQKESEVQGITNRILAFGNFTKFEVSGASLHELSIRAAKPAED